MFKIMDLLSSKMSQSAVIWLTVQTLMKLLKEQFDPEVHCYCIFVFTIWLSRVHCGLFGFYLGLPLWRTNKADEN